jgi:isoleucyl-tRNA synthetase
VVLGISDAELLGRLSRSAADLKILTQVAELTITDEHTSLSQPLTAQEIPGLLVQVSKAAGEKCKRCWFTLTSVGQDSRHPEICHRCLQVLEG